VSRKRWGVAIRHLGRLENPIEASHLRPRDTIFARSTAPETVRVVHRLEAIQRLNYEIRQRAPNRNTSLLGIKEQSGVSNELRCAAARHVLRMMEAQERGTRERILQNLEMGITMSPARLLVVRLGGASRWQ